MKTDVVHLDDVSERYLDFRAFGCGLPSATNSCERDRMKRLLVRVMSTELTEQQRLCLTEYIMDGKKQKDIAQELGLSCSTVSRHISAGKRKLHRAAEHFLISQSRP